MTQISTSATGGQIIVETLINQGVDTAFCVPGESYLEVLDGLYAASDSINLVTCRHENGADTFHGHRGPPAARVG